MHGTLAAMVERPEQERAAADAGKEASMLDKIRSMPLLLAAVFGFSSVGAATAQETAWRVSKYSGDAMVIAFVGGGPVPLASGALLQPGDMVQTGANGRALLVRGSETILVSPGSTVGIPAEANAATKSKSWTTIQLQSGSILLEVERRDTKHFEVETPYLAAIVKGTQFRVTVDPNDTRVDVFRGQVEVSDFKSGQYALVNPSQAASVAPQGRPGLSLSGSGTLGQIQQGPPRRSSLSPLPAGGSAPVLRNAAAPREVLAANAVPSDSPAPGAASGQASGPAPAQGAASTAGAAGSSSNPPERWSAAQGKESGRDGWMPRVREWLNGGGERSRKDDIAISLSMSLAFGVVVAVAVGARRNRRKSKPHTD
jgi:hypothetical protein